MSALFFILSMAFFVLFFITVLIGAIGKGMTKSEHLAAAALIILAAACAMLSFILNDQIK